MKGKVQVIEGGYPVTILDAVKVGDGSAKSLKDMINNGEIGGTGAVSSAEKRLHIFNTSKVKRLHINHINKTITIPHGLRYQKTDGFGYATHYNEVILDYNGLKDDIVTLVFDAKNNEWIVYDRFNVPSGDRNLYFVTSFKQDLPFLLSYNSDLITVTYDSPSNIIELTTLGDSLTSANDWQNYCMEKLGQVFKVNNLGIGGSTLADANGGLKNPMCNRTSDIPSTTKYLIVMGGTNDSCAVGALSTNGEFDKSTYIGAYESIIKDAYVINPNMQIILMTPPKKFNSGVIDPSKEKYRDATIEVAKRYGLPCVNIHDNLGVNEYTQPYLMSDGVHFRGTGNASRKVGHMLAGVLTCLL